MANDADIRHLTMAVKGLERNTKELVRVLETMNKNFVEFVREVKKTQE